MDVGTISLVLVVGMLIFLAIGMPLGLASAVLALLVMIMKFEPTLLTDPFSFGEGLLTSRPGTGPLYILAQKIFDLLTEYVLISVPLFIFMASLLERSGVAKSMYDSLDFWLSRVRGGIAIVTSVMAVLLAAMSGIIGGEIVLLGLIALPQMLRLGYDQNLAIGTICASGSLGTMIPPSIVLIIYGLITETSIKALFTGAFLPGFMLASFIIIYIVTRTRINPSLAPLPDPGPDDPEGSEKRNMFLAFLAVVVTGLASLLLLRVVLYTLLGTNAEVSVDDGPLWLGMSYHIPYIAGVVAVGLGLIFFVSGRERASKGWQHGKGLIAPVTIIGIVLGSIYGGVTGITEAAGMGALAVLVIALLRGEASFRLLWDSLMRTLRSTGTIIWVTIGAAALSGAYTLAGGPTYIAELIVGANMPTFGVLLTMMLILLFMGAFMDWVGIVLLIIPVFLPIVKAMPIEEIGFIGQLDPSQVSIWFGVLFCMNMQVSFLSPPFGGAAFYLKSVAPPHISLTDIFRGFLPFIGLQLLALSVLLIWPSIVTIFL
ncbi:TRAP transporter large permease [Granulosicoccus antarcticus]|uniref:C4-dicarboxylate TRAP transporter large permease protein DctM n=1 Tax=Granulosicoccus antarcticus IMCC3135 TaxID=1192854 RepID=A0A2Z2P3M3_9GAMM|nr:TRAP transporter large permease subunit [Granulosicoccus antarcticus]ASJ75217.1 C4-dicarboxylate TRAP transporter large permease protein DctM [Granulosicoccus antarcticus IMCC3135]